MKKSRITALVFLLLIAFYVLGPTPDHTITNKLPFVPENLEELESWIEKKESAYNLKEDNQARIVWADSSKKVKTAWSVVYMHGFSASQGEGYPLHREFAQRYGMNLFLNRMAGHGLKGYDGFKNLTAADMTESAMEALAVADRLGDKVIVMGTSTGGTLALLAAASHSDKVDAVFLFSPLIDFYDGRTWLLDKPWGNWITKKVVGGEYRDLSADMTKEEHKYWYDKYHINGMLSLKALVNEVAVTPVFRQVKQPVFVGYFYKNESEQDMVVSVKAIINMAGNLGTSEDEKKVVAFPNGGDHVITSNITSPAVEDVQREVYQFAEGVLGLKPLVTQ